MDQDRPATPPPPVHAPPVLPWYHWRRVGFNFLTLSVLAHLLFGLGAAYVIVQTISSRKQTFAGKPAGPTAPTRALEHQVQMQKKQATMSAPAAVKRVVTVGAAKVALPAMPPVFNADAAVVPLSMAGMGGSGVGLGMGGGGGGGGNGGGGGMTMFGSRSGQGLVGTFYDFKQTSSRQPTGIDSHKFADLVSQFVNGGWNLGQLSRYFKGPQPIYAQQIFIPSIPASEGPAAFGVEKDVKPSLWVVYYKGSVSPTVSGTYHFVGGGDDILMVRINGRLVFSRNWDNPGLGVVKVNWRAQANYDYHYPPGNLNIPNGFAKGDGFDVTAGSSYNMEVLIGEESPPYCFMTLMIARDGDEYEKDASGNPLFPVFQLSRATLPPPTNGAVYPPHAEKPGPLWRSVSSSTSMFN